MSYALKRRMSGTRYVYVSGMSIRTLGLDIPKTSVRKRIMDIAVVDVRRFRRAMRKAKAGRVWNDTASKFFGKPTYFYENWRR